MAYIIIGLVGLTGLAAVGFMVFQLIKEIKPTIQAAKSAGALLQETIHSTQPLAAGFKSISKKFTREMGNVSAAAERAREVKDQLAYSFEVMKPLAQSWSIYKASRNSVITEKKAASFEKGAGVFIESSKKKWKRMKDTIRKRFGKKSGMKKIALRVSLPVLAGVAVGGYAGYVLRPTRVVQESTPMSNWPRQRQPQIRRLPHPETGGPDVESEEDRKMTRERTATLRGKGAVLWAMLKESYNEWSENNAAQLGASLAYYTVFSLSPLLIIVVAIAGLLFGRQAAQGEIVRQVSGVIGYQSAEIIQKMIENSREPATGIFATIAGFITLLLGATGVFGELQSALERIWKIPPKPGRGILGLLKERFVSFTMILGIGFLLLVSLVLSAALSAFTHFVGDSLQGSVFIFSIVSAIISFAVITLLFAMIYKILPDVKIEWRDVWLGALITSLFFAIGKYLIGLYLGKSSVASTFGAAGSLVVILVWVYYSAQIFLYGAEFTRVYARRRGSWMFTLSPEEKLKPERKAS